MTDPTSLPRVTFDRRPARPRPDEVPSTVTVRRYRARSTGLNNGAGVWVIGPVLAEVHVRRYVGDVYRATASVHVDGRHQWGEPAEFLGADGLPVGGPLTDWHELPAPAAVELRHTGELVEGDVVQLHGMRLRLGPVTEYAGSHGPAWRSTGELLNVAEVEAAAAADPAGAAAFIVGRMRHDHPGTWTVQGNRFARWTVELPAPELSPAALAMSVDCPVCGSRVYRGADRCGSCGSPRPGVAGWAPRPASRLAGEGSAR